MQKFPQVFTRIGPQLVHILGIPFFMLAFATIYNPFDIQHLLELSGVSFGVNMGILLPIVLGVFIISRLSFFFFRKLLTPSWPLYIFWCVAEFVATAFFCAMYLCLRFPSLGNYFTVVFNTGKLLFAFEIIPYILISLILWNKAIAEAKVDEADKADERVKFYDYARNLRLVVRAGDLLYIEAQVNNVCIHYTEQGALKTYSLRASMRSIEDKCESIGMARCHRSYFVKASRVKVLSKDKEGMIFAVMDDASSTRVPVTKRYYDILSSML